MDFHHRLFAPEYLQTTAMDCAPASLACVLSGLGIQVSFERLREACQTDIDGTSIDTMEDVANAFGLPMRQLILPEDAVFDAVEDLAPCVAVIRHEAGLHFVVCWRRHGPLLQIMDPALGRRWVTRRAFEKRLYRHVQEVNSRQLQTLIRAPAFRRWFAHRAKRLGLRSAEPLMEKALATSSVLPVAALDFGFQMVDQLVSSGAVAPGPEAEAAVERAVGALSAAGMSGQAAEIGARLIRAEELFVHPSPHNPSRWVACGAVVLGLPAELRGEVRLTLAKRSKLPRALARAADAPKLVARRELWRMLGAGARWLAAGLLLSTLLTVVMTLTEALLFRAALEAPTMLVVGQQRLVGAVAVVLFLLLALAVEYGLVRGGQRLGEVVETRVRVRIFQKLPEIASSYFGSRPVSDMAERAHSMFEVRAVPRLFFQFARTAIDEVLTVAAISLLDLTSGAVALIGLAFSALAFWVGRRLMEEREFRLLNHSGGLSLVYRDALTGGVAVRAHGAEENLRQVHESRLVEWLDAARSHTSALAALAAVVTGAAAITAIATVLVYHSRHHDAIGLLLLLFWLQRIPGQVQQLMQLILSWPRLMQQVVRVLEPLQQTANSGSTPEAAPTRPGTEPSGLRIDVSDVTARAGGNAVLQEVSVSISAGEHIAIVGHSGAGKSSFARLLLGLLEIESGSVRMDGVELDPTTAKAVRQHIAWLDPKVQIWNRSLLENLRFGNELRPAERVAQVVAEADLEQLAGTLPRHLLTELGDSGCLVSGGEGQRVRCGRAFFARDARFVVLDEPFRGLGRAQRTELLKRAREIWREATLLCITHDIAEADLFDRVLVFEGGRIVEDASPRVLYARPGSRYRHLSDMYEGLDAAIWRRQDWRRLHVDQGNLSEG